MKARIEKAIEPTNQDVALAQVKSNQNREPLTWGRLLELIEKLSDEQKREPVRCWGEESPLKNDCSFHVDNKDWLQDEDWIDGDSCYMRGEGDKDAEVTARVVLKAGAPYIAY